MSNLARSLRTSGRPSAQGATRSANLHRDGLSPPVSQAPKADRNLKHQKRNTKHEIWENNEKHKTQQKQQKQKRKTSKTPNIKKTSKASPFPFSSPSPSLSLSLSPSLSLSRPFRGPTWADVNSRHARTHHPPKHSSSCGGNIPCSPIVAMQVACAHLKRQSKTGGTPCSPMSRHAPIHHPPRGIK